MDQPDQSDAVANAIQRIQERLDHLAPLMGARVKLWMASLAGSANPADYYLRPNSFPLFLLTRWCEQTCGVKPDPVLQQDMAYVSAAGYYSIRIVDDLMDGDKKTPPYMLPASNFFMAESLRTLQKYFTHGHPFWDMFDHIWAQSSEVTVEDAAMEDINEAVFYRFAGQKQQAANILIAAVCHHYGRVDLIVPWSQFVKQFSCWSQMFNDVFDWAKDCSYGANTYFLCEAKRRKRPAETLAEWVAREGFGWACVTLQDWMARAQTSAQALDCPAVDAYLDERAMQFAQKADEIRRDLPSLSVLLAALNVSKKVDVH